MSCFFSLHAMQQECNATCKQRKIGMPQKMDYSDKCWCCLREDNLRNLWSDYLVNGKRENYGLMLIDCFEFEGLELMKSKESKICTTCISRLQTAVQYKNGLLFTDPLGDPLATIHETAFNTVENLEIVIKSDPESDNEENIEKVVENSLLQYLAHAEKNGIAEHGDQTILHEEPFAESIDYVQEITTEFVDVGIKEEEECSITEKKVDKGRGPPQKHTDDKTVDGRHWMDILMRSTDRWTPGVIGQCPDHEVKQVLQDLMEERISVSEARTKLKCSPAVLNRELIRFGFLKAPAKPLNRRQLCEVMEDLKQGKLTYESAAKKYNCDLDTFMMAILEGGALNPSRQRPLDAATIEDIVFAVSRNELTHQEAAVKLNRSPSTVMGWLKRLRVRPSDLRRPKCSDEIYKQVINDLMHKRISRTKAISKLKCSPLFLQRELRRIGYASPIPMSRVLSNEVNAIVAHTNATPFKMTSGRGFHCAYCPVDHAKKWDAKELREHTREAHSERITSNLRISTFNNKIKFKGGGTLRIDVSDLQCTVCSISLSWHQMFEHLENVHSLVFKEAKMRLMPIDLSKKDFYVCLLCDESLSSLDLLHAHMGRHYNGGQSCNDTCCEYCGKTINKYSLQNHIRRTHASPRTFKCFKCDERFSSPYERVLHVFDAHRKIVIYHCKTNNEKRKSLAEVARQKRCPNNKKEAYICDVCGVKIKSKGWAQTHRRYHFEALSVPCHFCDAKFKYKDGLNRHIRKCHRKQHLESRGITVTEVSDQQNEAMEAPKTKRQLSLQNEAMGGPKPKRQLSLQYDAMVAPKMKRQLSLQNEAMGAPKTKRQLSLQSEAMEAPKTKRKLKDDATKSKRKKTDSDHLLNKTNTDHTYSCIHKSVKDIPDFPYRPITTTRPPKRAMACVPKNNINLTDIEPRNNPVIVIRSADSTESNMNITVPKSSLNAPFVPTTNSRLGISAPKVLNMAVSVPTITTNKLVSVPKTKSNTAVSGPMTKTNKLVSGHAIIINNLVSGPTILTNELVSGPTITTNKLVSGPTITTNKIIFGPTITTNKLVSGPTITTNKFISGPTITTNKLVSGPKITTNKLVSDPTIITNKLVSGPTIKTNKLVPGATITRK